MLANMVIGIGADVAGLQKGIGDAEASVSGLGSKVNKFAGGMRKVGTGMSLAITAPILGFAKVAADELSSIETANQQTTASLKRMGPASLVSVAGVQKLAGSLQAISGQDDQLIQTGQNAILSFGAIDTATKMGAKAFNDASKVMVNFSEAAGVPVDAAGKQIAKSMASAAQGVLLLPRGMKLGAAETAKLTATLKSGISPAEKQAAVIAALGEKVKGAAQMTSAEKWAVLQDQIAGFGAELLSTLMPAIGGIIGKLGSLMTTFSGLSAGTKKAIAVVAVVAAVLGPLLIVVGMLIPAVVALAGAIGAVSLPVVAVVAAIALLVAGFIYLWKTNEGFRAAMVTAWAAIKATVVGALGQLQSTISTWVGWAKSFWDAFGGDITAKAAAMWGSVKTIISGALTFVQGLIQTVMSVLRGDWGSAWDGIKTMLSGAWTAIKGIVGLGIENIKTVLSLGWSAIKTVADTAWDAIKALALAAVRGIGTGLAGAASAIPALLASAFSAVLSKAKEIGGDIKENVVTAVKSMSFDLSAIPGKLWTAASGLIAKGSEIGSAIGGKIKDALNAVIGAWNANNEVSWDAKKVMGKTVFPAGSMGLPDLPTLAKGGLAYGSTLAHIGEYPGANANPEVVAPLNKLQSMIGGGGGGVQITITGNQIGSDYDVARIGDQLVRELRRQGVRL